MYDNIETIVIIFFYYLSFFAIYRPYGLCVIEDCIISTVQFSDE